MSESIRACDFSVETLGSWPLPLVRMTSFFFFFDGSVCSWFVNLFKIHCES